MKPTCRIGWFTFLMMLFETQIMENGSWNVLEMRVYIKAFFFSVCKCHMCEFSGPDRFTLLSLVSFPEERNMNMNLFWTYFELYVLVIYSRSWTLKKLSSSTIMGPWSKESSQQHAENVRRILPFSPSSGWTVVVLRKKQSEICLRKWKSKQERALFLRSSTWST